MIPCFLKNRFKILLVLYQYPIFHWAGLTEKKRKVVYGVPGILPSSLRDTQDLEKGDTEESMSSTTHHVSHNKGHRLPLSA